MSDTMVREIFESIEQEFKKENLRIIGGLKRRVLTGIETYVRQHAFAIWSIADIEDRAAEDGYPVTDEICIDVLTTLENKHDATMGISWETITCVLEDEMRRNYDVKKFSTMGMEELKKFHPASYVMKVGSDPDPKYKFYSMVGLDRILKLVKKLHEKGLDVQVNCIQYGEYEVGADLKYSVFDDWKNEFEIGNEVLNGEFFQ